MKGSRPQFAPELWKKLMVVGEKQGTIKLKDLALEVNLSPEDTLSFLRQIFPMGIGATVYQADHECLVDIDANAMQFMLPLSPAEWIQLNQILTSKEIGVAPKGSVLSSLINKVTDNGPIQVVMELLNQLELWDQQLNEKQMIMMKYLDEAIADKKLIRMTTNEGKTYHLFPCKVLHLEGRLSLVAEDSLDHCLLIIALNEVAEFKSTPSSSHPRVSSFEIEEFIAAIRVMNEKETRLILKIHDPASVNLFPDYHFLGKPCMITNPNGDLIWAAYVEPCDGLFDWLITLGAKVEILDPMRFKEDYLIYCEEKLRKIA